MRRGVASAVLVLAAGPGMLWAGQDTYLFGTGELGFIETTSAAHVRCVGGEPTGTFPSCTEGTQRIFAFSEQQLWWPETVSETVAPMLTGPITFEVNCSLDAQYRGPCWGTFRWEVQGGTWQGHWTMPVMDMITYESELHMVGVGEGGHIDGLNLRLDGSSNPGDWYIGFNVRIIKK